MWQPPTREMTEAYVRSVLAKSVSDETVRTVVDKIIKIWSRYKFSNVISD